METHDQCSQAGFEVMGSFTNQKIGQGELGIAGREVESFHLSTLIF